LGRLIEASGYLEIAADVFNEIGGVAVVHYVAAFHACQEAIEHPGKMHAPDQRRARRHGMNKK
jgi:hypothetical protein